MLHSKWKPSFGYRAPLDNEPDFCYQYQYEAQSNLRFKLAQTQWWNSGEWGCLFDRWKVTLGKTNYWWKINKLLKKAINHSNKCLTEIVCNFENWSCFSINLKSMRAFYFKTRYHLCTISVATIRYVGYLIDWLLLIWSMVTLVKFCWLVTLINNQTQKAQYQLLGNA